jgi:3-oxoacyl-[acyl-carrier protein] reductase
MDELKGKVALVTGGARGIGKAIALELAEAGCHVIVSDIDLESSEKVVTEVEKFGVRSIAVKTDVSISNEVETLIKKGLNEFGQIDILVNNAGITRDNLLMRMTEEDWDLVLRINLKGAFLCTKHVIRHMMKQRNGKIINISSVVGVMGNPGQANYAASKAGLIGFTKSIAKETASRNIQVNAIAPGYIETEMTEKLSEEVKNWFLTNVPAKRPGLPKDVAKVVLFLATSASDYITGQVIHVDGGLLTA